MKKKDTSKSQSYRVGDHKLITVFPTESNDKPVFQVEQFFTDEVLPLAGETGNKRIEGSKLSMQFTTGEMRVLLDTGIEWIKSLIKDDKL